MGAQTSAGVLLSGDSATTQETLRGKRRFTPKQAAKQYGFGVARWPNTECRVGVQPI